MSVTTKKLAYQTSIVGLTIFLSACGATAGKYQPIVDGPTDQHFHNDLAACQTLSKERSYTNDDVKSEAALGAGIGAVIGGIEDESIEGAIAGAVIGGALSAGERAWLTREERKGIIVSCMMQRGHRVVG